VTLELDDGCSIIILHSRLSNHSVKFIKLSLSWTTYRGGAINVFRRSHGAGARRNASEYCQSQSPEVDKQAVEAVYKIGSTTTE
jgi:hypothetical protein